MYVSISFEHNHHYNNPAPYILYYSTLIFLLTQTIYWKLLFIDEDMNLHNYREGENVPEIPRAILHSVACLTFPMMLSGIIFSIIPHT